MYSKAKVLGISIHPMLVGFPITFYLVTFFSYVTYESNGDVFWFRVAFYANLAGVATAIIAAIPGLIDWGLGIPKNSVAKMRGAIHGLLNTVALILFSWNIFHMRDFRLIPPNDVIFSLIVTGLGLVATIFAVYQGFTLRQVNKVGIELTPEQERLEPGNKKNAASDTLDRSA